MASFLPFPRLSFPSDFSPPVHYSCKSHSMPPAKHQELQGTGSAHSAASCFACALPGFSADWSPFRGGRGWPWLAGDAPILLLTHPLRGIGERVTKANVRKHSRSRYRQFNKGKKLSLREHFIASHRGQGWQGTLEAIGPKPLPKRSHLQPAAQDHIQVAPRQETPTSPCATSATARSLSQRRSVS